MGLFIRYLALSLLLTEGLLAQEEMRRRAIFTSPTQSSITRTEALAEVRGFVLDQETGEPLAGVLVRHASTNKAAMTGPDGSFTLKLMPEEASPDQKLVITLLGYEEKVITLADLESGSPIQLVPGGITLKEIQIVSSTANLLITPVNFTKLEGQRILELRGSQDVTEAFRFTPSTFASREGGGWGDSRINLRGFEQENIAVLVNGVPTNDMESGRVYWSNWVGILEVADEIQVQKGIGNARIVLPTIGGTLNLRTLPPQQERRFTFSAEVSNVYASRYAFVYHSGLSSRGWAVTLAGSRAAGPGYAFGTNFEAWNYYAAISKFIGERHRILFQVLGAPQWHYHRFVYLTKRDVDTLFRGPFHNYDVGYYNGQLYSNSRNYYHKPLISLGHFWQISPKARLLTTGYFSFGRGGGSGILSVRREWNPTASTYRLPLRSDGLIDWEQVRQDNRAKRDTLIWAPGDTLVGYAANLIHRNSVNFHNWYGLLSTLNLNLGPFEVNAGADLRYYVGYHYRVVKDLFGADFWIDTFDVRNGRDVTILTGGQPYLIRNARLTRLGDRVNYDYNAYVTYLGGFSEIKYDRGPISAVIVLAGTQSRFARQENFRYRPEERPLRSQPINIFSYVAKVGMGLRLTESAFLYANGGYFTRPPFFQFLFINDRAGNEIAQNYDVEKILQGEVGLRWQRAFYAFQASAYYIRWRDKVLMSANILLPDGSFTQVRLNGLSATHKGLELEGGLQPLSWLRLSVAASLGDWRWDSDVFGIVRDHNQQIVDTVEVYAKGLRVGSAPQTQILGTLRLMPTRDIAFEVIYAYYDRFWATFEPESRNNPSDRTQPWRLPSYSLVDLAASYEFALTNEIRLRLFGNVHNLLDTRYIVTALDGRTHDQNTARFFYGFGRTWNFGFRLLF